MWAGGYYHYTSQHFLNCFVTMHIRLNSVVTTAVSGMVSLKEVQMETFCTFGLMICMEMCYYQRRAVHFDISPTHYYCIATACVLDDV